MARIAAGVLVVTGILLFFTMGSVLGAIVGMTGFAIFGWAMTRPSSAALVGQKCKQCGGGIFVEAQADRCPTCQAPLHARCLDAHAKTH